MAYASMVSGIGLMLLFLGSEMGLNEFPSTRFGNVSFPHEGSRLILGMAFLGAYLLGIQHIMRRYSLNDLSPTVYFDFSMQMILAATIAVVIYNAYGALASGNNAGGNVAGAGGGTPEGGTMSILWPALAFLIGTLPYRVLRWFTGRLSLLAPELTAETEVSVRKAPLELIEGIESHDRLRLEELGIGSCYDLATANFVSLLLKTSYDAQQLLDWILQAKLCVYLGEAAVKDLRAEGIRTILDIAELTPRDLEGLAVETAVTKSALERIHQSIKREAAELELMREIGRVVGVFLTVGRFWTTEDNHTSEEEHTSSI